MIKEERWDRISPGAYRPKLKSEWWKNVSQKIAIATSLFAASPAHSQIIHPDDLPTAPQGEWYTPGPRIQDEKGDLSTDDTHGRAGPRMERFDLTHDELMRRLKDMEPGLRKQYDEFQKSRKEDREYMARWKEDYTKMRNEGEISDEELKEFHKYVDELYETLEKGFEKAKKLLDELKGAKDAYNKNQSKDSATKLEKLLRDLYDLSASMEVLMFDFSAFIDTEDLRNLPDPVTPKDKGPEAPTG